MDPPRANLLFWSPTLTRMTRRRAGWRRPPPLPLLCLLLLLLLLGFSPPAASGQPELPNVPNDLLQQLVHENAANPAAALGGDVGNLEADFHPRATNECGGKCSCLGEYMDCANLRLSDFEERLSDWIHTLDLSHNNLADNIAQFVGNSTALIELKLRSNLLQKFPVFRGLSGLKTLQLAYNRIEVISAEALLALPALVSLDLSKNLIRLVTANAFPATNRLKNLNLNFNRIDSLDEQSLSHLRHLVELRLSQNKLRSIPFGIFRGLRKLRRLELNDNQLSELSFKTFANLTNLRALRMRGNRLRELATGAFHSLVNLDILDLDNNQLTEINKSGLYNLSSLTTLSLANNSIASIATSAFEFSQHLENLDLSNNQLTALNAHTFDCLQHLVTLNLHANNISKLTDSTFNCTTSLEVLDLSANSISYVVEDGNGPFRALRQLTRLQLAGNAIKSVNRMAFVGLGALRELDLSANNISTIQADAFARLAHLQSLAMNTSNLLCDCNLQQFHAWLKAAGAERFAGGVLRASCGYPASARGRPLQLLQAGTFTCEETPKPRIVEEPPAQVLAIRERNTTLTCSATTSSAVAASAGQAASAMTLEWRRDQVELRGDEVEREVEQQPNTNSTIATARLRLVNVSDAHAGRYQCVVSNAYGTTYSQKVRVAVASFPQFRKIPANLTINATSTARLDCAATGEPRPQISWEKDGGNDFPAARERRMHVMTEDDAFFIVNAKAADQGVYTCTAENSAGAIKANTTLTVHETPRFAKRMENREVPLGSAGLVECPARGSPRPTIRWFRGLNESRVPFTATERHFFAIDGQLLVIMSTEAADAGTYTCQISNPLGTVSGSMVLKVQQQRGGGGGDGELVALGGDAAGQRHSMSPEEISALVIITVVCCAVCTSLIWLAIIYAARRRRLRRGAAREGGGGGGLAAAGHSPAAKGVAAAAQQRLAMTGSNAAAAAAMAGGGGGGGAELDAMRALNGTIPRGMGGSGPVVLLSAGSSSLSVPSSAAGRYENESLLSAEDGDRTPTPPPRIVPIGQQRAASSHASSGSRSPAAVTIYGGADDGSGRDSGRGDSGNRSCSGSQANGGGRRAVVGGGHRRAHSAAANVLAACGGGGAAAATAAATVAAIEMDELVTPSTMSPPMSDGGSGRGSRGSNGGALQPDVVHIQANRLSDLLLEQQQQRLLRQSYGTPTATTSSSSASANSSLSDSIPQVPLTTTTTAAFEQQQQTRTIATIPPTSH